MKTVNLVICLALVVASCSLLSEAANKTTSDVKKVVNPIIFRAVEDYSLTLAKTQMFTSTPNVLLKGIGKMVYMKKTETIEVLAYFHKIDNEDVERNCSCRFIMRYFKQDLNMPEMNPFKMTNYKCSDKWLLP